MLLNDKESCLVQFDLDLLTMTHRKCKQDKPLKGFNEHNLYPYYQFVAKRKGPTYIQLNKRQRCFRRCLSKSKLVVILELSHCPLEVQTSRSTSIGNQINKINLALLKIGVYGCILSFS
jgi:hypothetical protein